jgi:hypothetical protein
MPRRIPEPQRWGVIEKWMLGLPRNTISSECGLSNGAVSSIVDDWRRSTGLELAIIIRDIGVTLCKLGMSPAQCVRGLRVSKLIERIGLDENSIESFLSEYYTRCQDLGVNPMHIARYISGFVSLLDAGTNNMQEPISIQLIDRIFEGRKQNKLKLEEEITTLESKIDRLQIEKSRHEDSLNEILQQKRSVESDLNWNTDLRYELERNGLQVDDPLKLVKIARYFKESGVEVREMLEIFSQFKEMENAIYSQKHHVRALSEECRNLEDKKRENNEELELSKMRIRELDELKDMGFGLRELKSLRHLLSELAAENGGDAEKGNSVKRFIDDIEIYYADYLALRSKVEQLSHNYELFCLLLGTMSGLGPSISSYLRKNPTKNDIRELIGVIEGYPKTTTIGNTSSSAIRNEAPSQSVVQTNLPPSHLVNEQEEDIKIKGLDRETASNLTSAKPFFFEKKPRRKSNLPLNPPHPPLLPKPSRLSGDSTRTNLGPEKPKLDTTNYFGKAFINKNTLSFSERKGGPFHPDLESYSDPIFRINKTHEHKLNSYFPPDHTENSQDDFDLVSILEKHNKMLIEQTFHIKPGET